MTVFTRIWKQNGEEKGQIFYTDFENEKYIIRGQVNFNSWKETLENEKSVRAIVSYNGVIVPDWYGFKVSRNPRKNVTDMNLYHFSTSITYDEFFEKVCKMMN